MRKLISIILVFFFCINIFPQKEGRLVRIAAVSDGAPYCYLSETGKFTGFSVELIESILNDLGMTPEYIEYNRRNFDNKSKGIIEKSILENCDLKIMDVPSTAYKRNHYFSIPYSKLEYFVIAREEKPYNGFKDLTGCDVVALRGSESYNKIVSIGMDFTGNLIKVQNIPIGIKMLGEAVVDYMIIDDHALKSFRPAILNSNLNIYTSNFEPMKISFSSNNGELIRKINEKVNLYTQNGKLSDIYDKWLGYEEPESNSYFLYILILSLTILAGLSLLLSYTHRRVARIARRDLSLELLQREKRVNSFNMAMRSTGFIKWEYDVYSETISIFFNDFREETLSNHEIIERVDPLDREKFKGYIRLLSHQKSADDIILRLRPQENSDYRIYSVSCSVELDEWARVKTIYGILNDITNISQHNREVESLQRSMKMALDVGQMAAWTYNMSDDIFSLVHGPLLFKKDISLSEFISHQHPDDQDIFPSALNDVLEGRIESITVQIRFSVTGNDYRWYEYAIMGVMENGVISQIIGTRKDITVQMNSHIELEQSRSWLQVIIDKLPVPIYIKNPFTLEMEFLNESAKEMFRYDGISSWGDLVSEKCNRMCDEVDRQILSTGDEYAANEVLELSNNEKIQTYVKKIIINFNNHKQILAFRIDLSEREKLARAQKLISNSLPAIDAFTWNIDSRDHSITYSDSGRAGNDIDINTIEKCLEFVHPDDKEIYAGTLLNQIEKGEGEMSMIYRIRFSEDKPYEWWEMRGVGEVVNEGYGDYVILYGISLNVNEQKLNEIYLKESKAKLLEANKQNELILNNTSSGIMLFDNNCTLQWSNLSSYHNVKLREGLFGAGNKCYLGSDGVHDCVNCCIPRCLKSGSHINEEYDFGDKGIYKVATTPIFGETGVEGVLLKIDDITELKTLIKDLKSAKNKAEESEKLKMAFLANMSHEIRTPLNAIVGFSEMIQESDDQEERDAYMAIINKNNELLLRLIGDILDISRIESGAIDLFPELFDLSVCCADLYTTCQQRYVNSEIEFSLDLPYENCMIRLDKNRLIQVMTNFITNAFKYTLSGAITMGYRHENGGIKIFVSDTGIGIDEDKKYLVFERFTKLDDFAQGTGLGLPISKAIVEACGGQIDFVSTKDVGSCFWAWFPCEVKIENENYGDLTRKQSNQLSFENKDCVHENYQTV